MQDQQQILRHLFWPRTTSWSHNNDGEHGLHVPTIYNSMAQPREYERMIGHTSALVMTCCILVAVSGYYMFGSMVLDQVTLSLERVPIDDESAMQALTWLMVITSLSKFTLYLFPLAFWARKKSSRLMFQRIELRNYHL